MPNRNRAASRDAWGEDEGEERALGIALRFEFRFGAESWGREARLDIYSGKRPTYLSTLQERYVRRAPPLRFS